MTLLEKFRDFRRSTIAGRGAPNSRFTKIDKLALAFFFVFFLIFLFFVVFLEFQNLLLDFFALVLAKI